MAALAARAIHKRFGAVLALDGAEFVLNAGEIHALIGSNGCGKSTLCKIIAGAVSADAGELLLDDRLVAFANPAQAVSAGIEMFYQELSLIPAMTVAENVHLGREPLTRLGLVDRAALRAMTATELASFGAALGPSVHPDAVVSDLSADQRQLIEIVKVLTRRARILIFDEATAALDRDQVQAVFGHLAKLKAGGASVIFISHRMDEVFAIADRMTVMRNGRTVMTRLIAEVSREEVVAAMVGNVDAMGVSAGHKPGSAAALNVIGLGAGKVTDITMTLRAGEIVGLGGLHGQGQSDFLRALYGVTPIASGRIELGRSRLTPTGPLGAIRHAIAYVSGERSRFGILANRPIFENLVLALLVRDRHVFVARRALSTQLAAIIQRLAVKFASLSAPASELSGGNQQKVVIGRMLATRPTILLLDDPTKGIDLAAKADLYAIMNDLCARGVSILFYSSDDKELLAVADRILVFNGGRIVAELAGEQRTEFALYRAAYAGSTDGRC